MRLLSALAFALVWLLQASSGLAQNARLVQLEYATEPTGRLTGVAVTRLVAELRLAGFSVALPGSAEAAQAAASIAISETASGLRLEISSVVQGAATHVVLAGGESEVGALALQTSELLRAGLLPRVAQRAVVPPAPPAPEPAPTGAAFFDVGASLLTNGSTADHLPLLSFGAGYAWPEHFSASLGLDVPLASASFHSDSGSADYRMWLAGLHADYGFLRWRRGTASIGVCVGAARTTTTGHVAAPAEARSPALWSLSLGARAGVELRLTEHVAFISQVRALALSPNPVVTVLGDERRLGSPSLVLELGARLGG